MTNVKTTEQRPPAEPHGRGLRRGGAVIVVIALAVIAFLAGGAGGSYQGKLSDVQKNENSDYLPASAESTKVAKESTAFLKVETIPGFIVYKRDSGLTDADRTAITAAFNKIKSLPGVDKSQLTSPEYSKDKTAAAIFAPLITKDADGKPLKGNTLSDNEKAVIQAGKAGLPQGLTSLPAGAAGVLSALIQAFSGLDGALLGVVVLVVILILLFVYRSPILWLFPILSAVLALGMSSLVIYMLAKNNVLTLTGQSQGILSVLVLGAGTDYALLLISRYREELHQYADPRDAMIVAWKESAPAIVASAITVILGLLCLSFSELNSNKSLGPVAAIGIGCTLFVMMTFLPVVLALLGRRWVFWPRRPRVDHESDLATHGLWGRIAGTVGRRYRVGWIGALLVLVICLLGLGSLKTNGLSTAQGFTNTPDAVTGQNLYDAKFSKGAGAPAQIIAAADKAPDVIAAAAKVPGVSNAPGSVCVQIDYTKLSGGAGTAAGGGTAQQGCPPVGLQVAPVDGRILINAVLADSYDSPAAYQTIKRLRTAVHAVPGADAEVGGQSASTLDVQTASVHDRNLIIPIVLLVIFVVLAFLLRAIVAPVLLIATVVLSFLAALGVSGFAFTHIFHFAGADQSFPLYAFVFLVALGIDYNIFLMTRVREETVEFGTRRGIMRGLSVTGGVITSAGIVLAATFAALAVLPLVFLAEVGFTVAFGVLLDTIVVRSILVPSLSTEIGRAIWWPSKLARAEA
ncbi:MAG TPA: MMPL family transporter [Jatrophihabitans sp.]|nr:MMPL family transporter [Jatrophihabitans sp.]